jgi:hypothetical protein
MVRWAALRPLIDHLRSIDKRRVRRVFGELAAEEIAAIDEGLAVFLGFGGRLHGGGVPVSLKSH